MKGADKAPGGGRERVLVEHHEGEPRFEHVASVVLANVMRMERIPEAIEKFEDD